MLLYHPDDRSAIRGCRPLDTIHKRTHEQDAPAVVLQQVVRVPRVRYLLNIKAVAVILHGDLKTLVRIGEPHIDVLFFVKLVPVLDGICHRLANGKVDGEQQLIAQAEAGRKLADLRRRLVNGFDAAGEF